MLHKFSDLRGYTIQATDGEIGRVTDLLFDDRSWVVRWLVVEAGSWLSSREVLLPSSQLGLTTAEKSIAVELTRDQVKNSPDVGTQQPVSRQLEQSIYSHYGWYPYWSGVAVTGSGGYLVPPANMMPGARMSPEPVTHPEAEIQEQGDPHLRSAYAVKGYHIQASDGEIGHVEDFLVAAEDWVIRYLVIDTRNWWPGKLVLIVPEWAGDIRWGDRTVSVHLSRDQIKGAPEFDASRPFDRSDEVRLYGHYGLAGYWNQPAEAR